MDYQVQLNNSQTLNLKDYKFDSAALKAELNDQRINFISIGDVIISKHTILSIVPKKLIVGAEKQIEDKK